MIGILTPREWWPWGLKKIDLLIALETAEKRAKEAEARNEAWRVVDRELMNARRDQEDALINKQGTMTGAEPEDQWELVESPHHDLYAERLTSAIAIKKAAIELATNAANHPDLYLASLAELDYLLIDSMSLEPEGTFI